MLKELNRTKLRRIYTRNRLKQFVKRKGFWYSSKDYIKLEPKLVNERFKTNSKLKREAIKEYNKLNST
jgi:hypothetical protein